MYFYFNLPYTHYTEGCTLCSSRLYYKFRCILGREGGAVSYLIFRNHINSESARIMHTKDPSITIEDHGLYLIWCWVLLKPFPFGKSREHWFQLDFNPSLIIFRISELGNLNSGMIYPFTVDSFASLSINSFRVIPACPLIQIISIFLSCDGRSLYIFKISIIFATGFQFLIVTAALLLSVNSEYEKWFNSLSYSSKFYCKDAYFWRKLVLPGNFVIIVIYCSRI